MQIFQKHANIFIWNNNQLVWHICLTLRQLHYEISTLLINQDRFAGQGRFVQRTNFLPTCSFNTSLIDRQAWTAFAKVEYFSIYSILNDNQFGQHFRSPKKSSLRLFAGGELHLSKAWTRKWRTQKIDKASLKSLSTKTLEMEMKLLTSCWCCCWWHPSKAWTRKLLNQ